MHKFNFELLLPIYRWYIFSLEWNVIQLQEFIKNLNNRHPAIKFDFKFSETNIEVLDKTVYKNKEQNKLLATVYCKPTDRRNFLHCTSAHPRSLIKSIPYSQALRLKKICAKTSNFQKSSSVKGIIYKLRFQWNISRYRISTIIRYWDDY